MCCVDGSTAKSASALRTLELIERDAKSSHRLALANAIEMHICEIAISPAREIHDLFESTL